ncbi:MAG: Asp23/Gls24 family envelope stress response protein [Ruminiclostridium sp.]|nr:Asp23/Gls24 family envelope stress response protein [Ruminiclostridium sp.]
MDNSINGSTSGSLKVAANVLVSIAETAAAEVEGVAVNSKNGLAIVGGAPLSSKIIPPIRVKLGSEAAIIDISIVTELGHKAYEVARAVQEHVKSSVQNMTGIAVAKVNVKIVGITGK